MKNRIIKRLMVVAVLCALVLTFAVPVASAASYSNVYGQTQDRVRVRSSASTSAAVIDNIVKDACVYVLSSKTSGSNTFVQVRYRDSDGNTATGWVCQSDGKTTYIKILSGEQAQKAFGVKGGTLPSKRVGTFTASERSSAKSSGSSSSSSKDTVKDAQTKLKALGFYTGEITGNVGDKTKAAIKAFQSKYGLTVDGVLGPQTLGKIDAVYASKGGSSSASTSGDIKLNSSGEAVRKLQQDLKELGFYNAEITGNVGAKTQAAIVAFQRKYGLTADGVAGAKTLAAIASALRGTTSSTGSTTIIRLGSQGSRVSQLQQDLKTLGYYNAEITGNVGSKTQAAIKKFQEKNGLTADGIAGPDTLAAIAKQLGNGGSGSASGSSSSSGGTLRLNSTGDAVRALQQNLTTLGYYYGDITGHYGSMTEAAVRKFQQSRGLTADGVAGAKTLAAIVSALQGSGSSVAGGSSSGTALREGDSGAAVTELQNMLKALGYYYGDITGHFGSLTRQAVRKFQEANGLTVDGVAGSATMNKLRSLTGNGGGSSSDGSVSGGTVVKTSDSYGRIIKDNVYLRSSYSTTSAAKASLKKGTLVRITKTVTSGGVKWYYITVTVGNYTYTGYVRSDMMETISEDDYKGAGGDSDDGAGDYEILGVIRVTGNNVRLRYHPSTDASIVGYAGNGDTFYYIDYVNGWYQTSSGYWISAEYVKVLSGKDEDDFLGSSSQGSYRLDDTGSMVTYIQEALKSLGYYTAEITGHFGAKTEAAVKAFQKDEGLKVDGVVGHDTLARLRLRYSGSSSATSPGIDKDTVFYNVDWFGSGNKSWLNSIGLARGKKAVLTDLRTNYSLNIYIQSTGNHADVEPVAASDTTTLCQIFGVSDPNKISYKRRPMLITVGDYKIVCSIYGQPHGSQTITNNGFPGQFCLHFLNSKTSGTKVVDKDHQAAINEAITIMKNKGASLVTK